MPEFREQFLEVIPIDSLLFRDGKPFSTQIHFAKSIFPPFPQSFAGLLRTHFGKNVNFEEEKMKNMGIGYGDDFGDFAINAAYIKKDGELYFQVPADLLHEKGEDKICDIVSPDENERNVFSSAPKNLKKLKAQTNKITQSFSSGFISSSDMKKYLSGDFKQIETIKILKTSDFVESEERTSVRINAKTAAAQEGELFTAELLRFKERVGFYVSFNGPDFGNKESSAVFGGEKRAVKLDKSEKIELPQIDIRGDKVKLLLTTPAFFENMQTPDIKIDGLELISAVSNGYENIGGWDLARHCPKAMKKAVKAGSVYYYKATQKALEKLKELNSLSFQEQQSGMGKFLIGAWK